MAGGNPFAAPRVDFYGMLTGLGQGIQEDRERARQQAALQSLGGISKNPDGTFNYAEAARALIQAGHPQGLAMAQLAATQAQHATQNAYQQETLGLQKSNQSFNQNAESVRLQLEALKAKKSEVPTVQDVYDPKTGQKTKAIVGPGGSVTQVGGVAAPPEDDLTKLQRRQDVKRVGEVEEEAAAARDAVATAGQIKQLREGVSYEGMPGARAIAPVAGWLGYGGGQALQAASVKYRGDLATAFKGAISDKEQATLATAEPGLGMSDAAAKPVLDMAQAAGERKIERGQFYRTYLATHKSLEGAERAWGKYLDENPILNTNKSGSLVLNKANLGKWQGYVGKPAADEPATAAPAAAPAVNAVPKFREGKRAVSDDGKTFVVFRNGVWVPE